MGSGALLVRMLRSESDGIAWVQSGLNLKPGLSESKVLWEEHGSWYCQSPAVIMLRPPIEGSSVRINLHGEPRLRLGRVPGHPAGAEAPAVEVGGRLTCASLQAQLLAIPRKPPSCIQSVGLATGNMAVSHEPAQNAPWVMDKIEEPDF